MYKPGGEFYLPSGGRTGGAWVKMPGFKFLAAFSSNLNTINLKIFPNHGDKYKFQINSANIMEKDKAHRVYENMKGSILHAHSEGWKLFCLVGEANEVPGNWGWEKTMMYGRPKQGRVTLMVEKLLSYGLEIINCYLVTLIPRNYSTVTIDQSFNHKSKIYRKIKIIRIYMKIDVMLFFF